MAKQTAFFITPIGSAASPERKRADNLLHYVLRPALEDVGLEPYRADLDDRPGSITPSMISELLDARIVIADLAGRNANVFYELGIAHAFRQPVITLVSHVSELPFDKNDERSITLPSGPDGAVSSDDERVAKELLSRALVVGLDAAYQPSNPVTLAGISRQLQTLVADNNPMAAELVNLRELVTQVLSVVRNTGPDAGSLLDFVLGSRPPQSWRPRPTQEQHGAFEAMTAALAQTISQLPYGLTTRNPELPMLEGVIVEARRAAAAQQLSGDELDEVIVWLGEALARYGSSAVAETSPVTDGRNVVDPLSGPTDL